MFFVSLSLYFWILRPPFSMESSEVSLKKSPWKRMGDFHLVVHYYLQILSPCFFRTLISIDLKLHLDLYVLHANFVDLFVSTPKFSFLFPLILSFVIFSSNADEKKGQGKKTKRWGNWGENNANWGLGKRRIVAFVFVVSAVL